LVVDPYKELQPVIEKHKKRMEGMGLKVIYIETPSAYDVKKAITNPNTKAFAWFGHGDREVPGLISTLAGEDITPGDIRSWAQEEISKKIGTPDTWKGLSPEERKLRMEMWNNAHFDLKYVYMHTCYSLKDNSMPDVLMADDGVFFGCPEKAYLKDTSIRATTIRGEKAPTLNDYITNVILNFLKQFDDTCFGKVISIGNPRNFKEALSENNLNIVHSPDEPPRLVTYQPGWFSSEYPKNEMRVPFDPFTKPNYLQQLALYHEAIHQIESLRNALQDNRGPNPERNTEYAQGVVQALHHWAECCERRILTFDETNPYNKVIIQTGLK